MGKRSYQSLGVHREDLLWQPAAAFINLSSFIHWFNNLIRRSCTKTLDQIWVQLSWFALTLSNINLLAYETRMSWQQLLKVEAAWLWSSFFLFGSFFFALLHQYWSCFIHSSKHQWCFFDIITCLSSQVQPSSNM